MSVPGEKAAKASPNQAAPPGGAADGAVPLTPSSTAGLAGSTLAARPLDCVPSVR